MNKTDNEKIQAICEKVRTQTLEPALLEASRLIQEAELKASEIIESAKKEKARLLNEAENEIKQLKILSQATLSQASKMALESLKTTIINELFAPGLLKLIEEGIQNNSITIKLVESVINALEAEGLKGDVTVYIAQNLKPQEIMASLGPSLLSKVASFEVGEFKGGVRIKIKDRHLSIDITDDTLKELMLIYIKRSEFRDLIFKA